MATVKATEFVYDPLPTLELLEFTILEQKEEVSRFDKDKTVLNVVFGLDRPDLKAKNRKTFKSFGLYWPNTKSKKNTKLFELVQVVDPKNAKKEDGYEYDTKNLEGKKGLLMIERYKKETDPDTEEEWTGERIMKIVPLKPTATPPPVAAKASRPSAKKPVAVGGDEEDDIPF